MPALLELLIEDMGAVLAELGEHNMYIIHANIQQVRLADAAMIVKGKKYHTCVHV